MGAGPDAPLPSSLLHAGNADRRPRAEAVSPLARLFFRAAGRRAPPLGRNARRSVRLLSGAPGETPGSIPRGDGTSARPPRRVRLPGRNDGRLLPPRLSARIRRNERLKEGRRVRAHVSRLGSITPAKA